MHSNSPKAHRPSGPHSPALDRQATPGSSLSGRAQCLYSFQKFLNSKRTGNDPVLKIWFQYFDKNQNGRIDRVEFQNGMKLLHYPWSIEGLWAEIDSDGSNELFFDEIEAEQAKLWNLFRRWCGSVFQGPRDMIRQLKQAYTKTYGQMGGQKETAFQLEVIESLPVLGWEGGSERMLFAVLDLSSDGSIGAQDVKWVEAEITHYKQKEETKKRMKRMNEYKVYSKKASRIALVNFKYFLRSKYGPLFRAWRRVLDVDGTMTVPKAELFKACRQLCWAGDMRALWKALDPDSSGYCSFEELDPHSAQLLSQFREWAVSTWGPEPAEPMFYDLDVQRRKKLDYATFAQACCERGFANKPHTVAACFDSEERRSVQVADFACLSYWNPPSWLVAHSNAKAAQEFKNHLLNKYGRFVKAWRSVMDKDNSNSCNWAEFNDTAKAIRFHGDIAGAWRFFDADFSGFITLQEIDAAAHDILMEFKTWSDEEFGGVRSAFMIMDKDKSKQVSYREFRSACRQSGFSGDVQRLFENLVLNLKSQVVRFEEVSFLDHWETHESLRKSEEELWLGEQEEEGPKVGRLKFDINGFVPGPGAYSIQTGMGAGPVLPSARHGGGFSFGRRTSLEAWSSGKVGPGKYESCKAPPARRQPSWGFGRTPRSIVPEPMERPSSRHSSEMMRPSTRG